jgi:hypothetical protein
LAILPGCQHFPYFAGTASEAPRKIYDRNETVVSLDPKHVSGQTVSTAQARDEEKPIAKPPVIVPQQTEVKSPSFGSTGIITLDGPGTNPVAQEFKIPLVDKLPTVEKKIEVEPIVMALDLMLKGRHAEAIKHLSAYEEGKQQLLLRFLPSLVTLVKKRTDDLSTQEVAVLIQQLEAFADDLRPRSELLISRMCYCREVQGFASYKALPDNYAFLTGTQDRIGELVQLYVELKNVTSVRTKEGGYLTKLSCWLELHDSTGKRVPWDKRYEGDETLLARSSRVNDFYSRYGFYVPPLAAGTYKLTIHVKDETNPQQPRQAERSLVFQVTPVASQPPLR